jgi:hypothetical protein
MSERPLYDKLDKFIHLIYYAIYPEGNGTLPDDKVTTVCRSMVNGYLSGVKIEGLNFFCENTENNVMADSLLHHDCVIDKDSGMVVKMGT